VAIFAFCKGESFQACCSQVIVDIIRAALNHRSSVTAEGFQSGTGLVTNPVTRGKVVLDERGDGFMICPNYIINVKADDHPAFTL
jgi:hypothetical protein